jgi:cell division protein FtsL
MITRATLIWMVLAIAAGFGLFQVSYRVATLEEELNKANRQIVEERERLHALQADWSYLSSPGRLAQVARRHLPLRPLAAEQMVRIEDLPLRLPQLMAEGEDFKQAAPVGGVVALEPVPERPAAAETAAAPANNAAPAPAADTSDDPIADLLKKVNDEQ